MTFDSVFGGKAVVVFSLPGAFTATCSSSHVPRNDQLAKALKANGVDEIVCLSVNGALVINEWHDNQQIENITFLPDGSGDFTHGMGMLDGREDLRFARRLAH
ncbi:MAG: peroxiredoxin [Gammaproteobacteria bacterium]